MRRAVIALLLCAPALASAAGEPAGRWEGAIRIPGRELPLVVDLAPGATGGWTGSLIMPGFGLKGAPLSNVVVGGADVAFDLGGALRSPTYGPASFSARLTGDDRMTGEMQPGRQRRAVRARPRSVRAQVEAPPRSTAVRRDLEAAWTRRVRARRLSAPRDDHARESRGAPARPRRSSSSASRRPTCRSTSSSRKAISCGSNRRSIASRSKARFARDRDEIAGHASSSGRSNCRSCCAAAAEDIMKVLRSRDRMRRPCWPEPAPVRSRCFAATPRTAAPTAATDRASSIASNGSSRPATGSSRRRCYKDGVIYFGGDDGNVYAVDAADGRQRLEAQDRRSRSRHAGDRRRHCSTSAATTASSMRSTRAPARTRWKFATEGERRFEAKGLHGMLPKNQTIADAFDVFLSSPVVAARHRSISAAATATSTRSTRIGRRCAGNSGPATSCTRRRRTPTASCSSAAGTATSTRSTPKTGAGEVALSRRRGSGHPQPGRLPVVAGGRRRRRLHRMPRFESLRDRRRHRQGEVALRTPTEAG